MQLILPISLTAAAVAALINIWLAIRVGQVRTREKVSVGDGGNEIVTRRMRAHANFTEFTPFVLILIVLIELATGSSLLLWVAMALYMVARVIHAFGMDGWKAGRPIGISLTMLTLIALGGYAIYISQMTDTRAVTPMPEMEMVPAG